MQVLRGHAIELGIGPAGLSLCVCLKQRASNSRIRSVKWSTDHLCACFREMRYLDERKELFSPGSNRLHLAAQGLEQEAGRQGGGNCCNPEEC